jgi:hypothetical protein
MKNDDDALIHNRTAPLMITLGRLNNNQGLGFKTFGVVVDKKTLNKIAFGVLSEPSLRSFRSWWHCSRSHQTKAQRREAVGTQVWRARGAAAEGVQACIVRLDTRSPVLCRLVHQLLFTCKLSSS